MPLRNAKALTVRPFGLCDAIDGSNAPPGAMMQLANLIPNPSTKGQYVCRPASIQATAFAGFTTPTTPTALLVIGNLAYGMISSAKNAGKDEPFVYDISTGLFTAITGVTAANSPTSPSPTGDWEPPTMCSVTNGRIMITHPGYNFAGGYAVGWLDISSFSSTGVTGTTHTSTTIDTLSANVITVNGWQVGYHITGVGIPANTYITAIASNGLSITLSQATTSGGAGVVLTVVGGTPAAPIYGAGQTAPIALTARPVAVNQFNGRAYYAVANAVVFSDPLLPTQISGDGGTIVPVLTLGDSYPVNALAPLPLTSQVTGGAVQALIAFKGDSEFYQITGDPETNNLQQNANPSTVGTLAPNSICGTPVGLAFIAPDGLRILQFSGTVTDPIGAHGDGVNTPFLYAINATRIAMAYNQNVLRVSVQNGQAAGQPVQEFWYDFNLKSWSGPHSFPAALISAYQGQPDHGFIAAASGINAKLWTSTVTPTANSLYTENSIALSWTYQTVLLPDNAEGAMNAIVESTLACATPQNAAWNVLAADEINGNLASYVIEGPVGAGSIWGSFTWGSAPWGAANTYFQQVQLKWPNPLVFKQMSVTVNGASAAGLVVGNLYLKYQILGYNYGPPV